MKTELLETLVAFHRAQSITEASTTLRISQSAASKRLAQLESIVGRPLFRREGRSLTLTKLGLDLAQNAQESLQTLQSILAPQKKTPEPQTLSMGISDSILSSWGGPLLSRIQKILPDLQLELHAHRSPVIVDKLSLGAYDIGLCAGAPTCNRSLVQELLLEEPMVLIGSKGNPRRHPIISIESTASTWKSIRKEAEALDLGRPLKIESYSAAVNLALNGFGTALAPLGISMLMQAGREKFSWIEPTRIRRPVNLIYRKTSQSTSTFRGFSDALGVQIEATKGSLKLTTQSLLSPKSRSPRTSR